MKRFVNIFLVLAAALLLLPLGGCVKDSDNPYEHNLYDLDVEVGFAFGAQVSSKEGIEVVIQNVDNGSTYSYLTDREGIAHARVVNGLYRISSTAVIDDNIFNGAMEGVRVAGKSRSVAFEFMKMRTGDIVIKEIYCGGCKRDPYEGDYQLDKYVILHNNSDKIQHLDSLCFGMVGPYNSTATNPWVKKDPATGANIYPDFVPAIQAIWQFGGDGQTFPLAPGEDAVVVVCGAINHTVQYPLSVNLSNPDYFVCYNPVYFPHTDYHPSPEGLPVEHYLNVVIKTGKATAYPFSVSCPAVIIFRAKGTTIQEYVALPDSVIPTPGSTNDDVVCIAPDWIEDAVEVFDGRSASNKKRLRTDLDAGYVSQSDIYLGHSLMRRVNESASAKAGYEVLVDTNNSGNDFYETSKQSLHE